MAPSSTGNRTARDIIGDGRPIWQILFLLQIANALDWGTSLIGVGLLGLPEQAPVARWMIAHLGVVAGVSTLKIAVGMGFTAMAWGTVWLASCRWAKIDHIVGFVWLMGVATALLAQTVLWNIVAIWITLSGGAGR